MNYGKFMYEQRRKEKEMKKTQHRVQMKEVQLRPNIEKHDFEFKMRHARKFLEEGNKVKIALSFRGREMAHKERGILVLDRVREALQDIAVAASEPKMMGRNYIMIMVPSGKQARKD
jgi:translation initiation factor IF-3